MTNRNLDVLMLAGALHPSPLQRQLGIPPLCLPLSARQTLLTAWIDALVDHVNGADIQMAVTTRGEAEGMADVELTGVARGFRVVVEPASWRGTGGIIRDLLPDQSERGVVVIEANCLPPTSLDALVRAADDQTQGVVGITDDGEPAGLYIFDQTALESIPRIGYFDLKEQLLPALSRRGCRIRAARVTDRVYRLRDRSSYLDAVRAAAERCGSAACTQSPEARICPSARIAGACIVRAQVVVEQDAVIHDSVLLDGAIVEKGAVVSRSVVAPGVRIPRGSIIIDRVASAHESALEGVAGGGLPSAARPAPEILIDAGGSL